MYLKHLSLQNFRSYTKSQFTFSLGTTIIVGPNASGKTNILEAIFLLSLGKSMRGHRSFDMVSSGKEMARVSAQISESTLEVVLTTGNVSGAPSQAKKFLVNGVPRRLVDFVGNLKASLFEPEDLELVHASPDRRRNFLDDVLIQVDRSYRQSQTLYDRALRQRNRMLRRIREEKREYDLEYWDNLLITHGGVITKTRENLINFLNIQPKTLGEFKIEYDKSLINRDRLDKYFNAERESGVTLVGPQRDDFVLFKNGGRSLEIYGSRGEQRMGVLWLKIGELAFLESTSSNLPLLLLDDIFSELDDEHIKIVSKVLGSRQTILTTSHKEVIPKDLLRDANVVEL